MSLPTVIAENQTGSPVTLTRLGLTVGASSTLTLTDYAFVNEIKQDESLHAAIVANQLLLNLGQGTLSKGDSLKFFAVVTLEVRRSVQALADANVASLSGTTTIDTVALAAGDRVLLTAQSTASENGIWVVQTGAWTRPSDFATGDSAAGALIVVQEGGTYADQLWQVTTNTGSDIIDTDTLALQQTSGGGGGASTLQDAYDGGVPAAPVGNTITTANSTDIAFTLTSGGFTVQGGGAVAYGNTTEVGSFSVFSAGTLTLQSRDTTLLDMQANDAAAKTLTVSASNAGAGQGNVAITADDLIDIDGGGAVSINSSGGVINIGDDAVAQNINIGTGAAARTVTIGNTTGATGVVIEAGTGEVLITSPNTTISGNLVVQGTTTTVESEIVNVKDNFLYLNDGYTTNSALEGGIIVNSLPTATNDTVAVGGFTAGVAATSNPTVATTGAATFSAGDFIQVSGAADQQNDGLYEVVSHAANVLTIAGVGTTGRTYNFFQNQFVTDTTVQGTITKVTVGVTQVDATGDLQYGYGADTGAFAFVDVITGGNLTLQAAYVGGNTITTSAAEGSVIIAGDQTLQVTATGGLDVDTAFDFDGTSFDVQMTGTNGFSIDGTAASNITVDAGNLTLSTTTSGEVLVDGVDGVEINSSGGAIDIGNDANAQAINVGTGAAARTITIGNTTGATAVVVNTGTEQFQVNGTTYYGTSAGLPTARAGGFQDGDKYYDTNLDMEMRYDAGRAKWLSIEVMTLMFGRDGNTNVGQYYRGGADGRVMSSTIGYTMPFAGTIIGLGYTRTDTDAATFDVVEGGTSRATLATAAASGQSRALDGDFSQNGILAVQNQAGGNIVSNVVGWVQVKFRGT